MGLIPGICTQCGATLSVDKEKDAMICPYCGMPFITEKAISIFNNTYNITNNITAQNVFVQKRDTDFEIIGGVLRKYIGASINVVVPNNVYSIGKNAFADTMIKTIKMPDTICEIEHFAFCNCCKLDYIDFSNGLKKMYSDALDGCTNLKEISLPGSILQLFGGGFWNIETLRISSQFVENQFQSYRAGGIINTKNILDGIRTPLLSDIYIDGINVSNNIDILKKYFVGSIPHTKIMEKKEKQQNLIIKRKAQNVCLYCGGTFSFWTQKCNNCGKLKDY